MYPSIHPSNFLFIFFFAISFFFFLYSLSELKHGINIWLAQITWRKQNDERLPLIAEMARQSNSRNKRCFVGFPFPKLIIVCTGKPRPSCTLLQTTYASRTRCFFAFVFYEVRRTLCILTEHGLVDGDQDFVLFLGRTSGPACLKQRLVWDRLGD